MKAIPLGNNIIAAVPFKDNATAGGIHLLSKYNKDTDAARKGTTVAVGKRS